MTTVAIVVLASLAGSFLMTLVDPGLGRLMLLVCVLTGVPAVALAKDHSPSFPYKDAKAKAVKSCDALKTNINLDESKKVLFFSCGNDKVYRAIPY